MLSGRSMSVQISQLVIRCNLLHTRHSLRYLNLQARTARYFPIAIVIKPKNAQRMCKIGRAKSSTGRAKGT